MDIKPDPYRYVNWTLYFLAAIVSNVPPQVFSGVSPTIRDIYQVSELSANSVSLLFALCCVLFLFPANYVIDQKGLKTATLICSYLNDIDEGFTIAGLLTRQLINVNFYFIHVGTLLCSIGLCFMISTANKFANIWFPRNQIFLVSSVCIFALLASQALGIFMSSFFIRK